MSNLSQALQKYYSRDDRRVLFRNGQSLNQLALAMWEHLGFQQIDASVLSRVIAGKRLLTTRQLKVLCKLLRLPNNEEDYLFACLEQDRSIRLGEPANSTRIPPGLVLELMSELTTNAFQAFYQGEHDELDRKYEVVRELARLHQLSGSDVEATGELLGSNLYLRGRMLANHQLPTHIIGKTYPIFRQLVKMSQTYKSQLLYSYAYALLGNAYYIAGGYSKVSTKHRLYNASIQLAKRAVENLPEDNHESLSAMRTMAASASYTKDHETINYVAQRAKEVIPKQPKHNYVNALHLGASLSKGLAATNAADPFSVREMAAGYFKRTLAHTAVYDVSSIKEEIDTLLFLSSRGDNYVHRRLKDGLELAGEYNLLRHQKYFNKLLRDF